jgi:UDP-N-acetylglucosamine--N-acetylmuramyl-(pentapeptide) pyrophosphoryl-undecaprenol N-acetylglucosamine transferase
VPAAIATLSEAQRARLAVTQQARADDVGRVRAAYADLGIAAQVAPFFSDMPAQMAAAHLVISRSGASTVSEISVIGRPALLVPYPHALDHDQAANAAALAAAGGAEVHPQSALSTELLASLIDGAMDDPARLETMAAAAKSAGRPDAAQLLADLAEAIALGKSVASFKQGARP